MDERKIIRTEYTAQLAHPAEELAEVIANCRLEALKRIEKGELMTAALYVYSKQLYLYAEWIGEEKTPAESFTGITLLLEDQKISITENGIYQKTVLS